MGFFELRLPDFGPTDEGEKAEAKARQAACKGATADVEGVALVAEVLEEARAQKERLGMLTGGAVGSRELPGGLVPLVLLSAAQVRGPACAHTHCMRPRVPTHSPPFFLRRSSGMMRRPTASCARTSSGSASGAARRRCGRAASSGRWCAPPLLGTVV